MTPTTQSVLLHEIPLFTALRTPAAVALTAGHESWTYAQLATLIESFADGMLACGLRRGQRVAIYLEKRVEMVAAAFGAAAAGCTFVPVNPLLKPDQVAYILQDCNVRLLVTSRERWATLRASLAECADLRHVVVVDGKPDAETLPFLRGGLLRWEDVLQAPRGVHHRVIDLDVVAILYTSGSTGKPKGVVLSHRNMVAGAKSVAQYLQNLDSDVLLAALPLSFDAGFSQLTTGFHAGARVVLLNYLLPKDVIGAMARERVTGLTAVPPLWIQLTQQKWPAAIADHLRYFANTGGRMPLETLSALRTLLPRSKPFLMYGLTEAFRATFLPPEEAERRPDSIGKAIPNAEVLVLREDGSECDIDEPGELVQRGALVGLGYWNDEARTRERYRPLPGREAGLTMPEIAVFSGDTVRRDAEGYLYFIGRRDEMIKTSGYRVSPNEVEEVLYSIDGVGECAAFGVPHPSLGQAIIVVVAGQPGVALDPSGVAAACRERLPLYMLPSRIEVKPGPLPRNPNGKIDRKALAAALADMDQGSAA